MFTIRNDLTTSQELQVALADTQLHLDKNQYDLAQQKLNASRKLLEMSVLKRTRYDELSLEIERLQDMIDGELAPNAPPSTPVIHAKK